MFLVDREHDGQVARAAQVADALPGARELGRDVRADRCLSGPGVPSVTEETRLDPVEEGNAASALQQPVRGGADRLLENSVGSGTVIRSAVDFSELASQQKTLGMPAGGPNKLQKLLEIVTKASEALLASTSLDETLEKVLELVFAHLRVDRGCIMMWDEQQNDLVVRAVKGNDTGSEIQFSRTIAEKVYRDKVSILTSDAMSDDRFAGGQSIIDLNIRSAMAAPLWNADRGAIFAVHDDQYNVVGALPREVVVELLSASQQKE